MGREELSDLTSAVREGADIGFVLVAQAIGTAHARARGEEKDPARWVPTEDERAMVCGPAERIARRHISRNAQSADLVDGILLATGVGGFTLRAAFGLPPIPPRERDR